MQGGAAAAADPESESGAEKPSKRKKAPKDPDAPKPPPSAYALFAADERAAARKGQQELTPAEVTKRLRAKWHELPEDEMAKYTAQHEQAKFEHDELMRLYNGN